MANDLQFNICLKSCKEGLNLNVVIQSLASSVAWVGPSGSGKSTLLRAVAGLDNSWEGQVHVGVCRWQDTATGIFVPAWKRGVGYVPQESLLIPTLSVEENLAFGGALQSDIVSVSRSLEIEGLLARRPRHLSGGEKQRVAIGRALLAASSLLLLDEPFSALDRSLRDKVIRFVGDYCRKRSIPIILVSHDESDVRALATEAWILDQGALVKLGESGCESQKNEGLPPR